VGRNTFHSWRGQIGWARNSLDNFLTPNTGMVQRFSAEVALPGSTAEYYKLNYDISKFWRLSRHLVLNTRVELGYGDSYGAPHVRNICFIAPTTTVPNPPVTPQAQCTPASPDYLRTVKADGLPFFENFYAGGVRSVRGFLGNTLGPRASTVPGGYPQPLGGAVKTIGSVEMFFPTLLDTPAARISAFMDVGNVFASRQAFDTGELRASTGVALMWRSPMGPITISYAFPFRKKPDDRLERLQFTFGGVF
ncbi:MAG: outer membrane protein assembly factor BamA, partial [Lysobacter sp.]